MARAAEEHSERAPAGETPKRAIALLALAAFASAANLRVCDPLLPQIAGGLLGELIGWRATLVVLGIVHMVAGLLLLGEMRRLEAGVPAPGGARWRHSASSAYSVLRDRWARTVLISVFIEGLAMFGGLAYVGADLHQRFGLSLGVVGALLASFGAGALFYSV